MGRSKALLPAGDRTFVSRLTAVLHDGGIDDVLVVGRPHDLALRAEVDACGNGVRYVENARAHEGQISSIVAALNVVDHPGVRGLLVVPVDQPLLQPATVAAVLTGFSHGHPPIARATYRGRHGHPVVFASSVFAQLRNADPAIGARVVLQAHRDAILDVEVPDEGAVIDVDDPATYERLFGRQP